MVSMIITNVFQGTTGHYRSDCEYTLYVYTSVGNIDTTSFYSTAW